MVYKMLILLGFLVIFAAELISADLCPEKCQVCQNNVSDCTGAGITNPPKDFDKNTRIIRMDSNAIRVLGKSSFRKMDNMEILTLNTNSIRVIRKDTFVNLPKLMTLDISLNSITRVFPKSFIGMEKLTTLNLANNQILTVTGVLDVLPSLFQLNLGTNRIRQLHAKTFYKNVNIHYLDLRYNDIVKIHQDAFKNLKYLRYLFLNNNPIAKVPHFRMGSPVLGLVDFSHCQLKNVPQGLPSSITDLRLGHNKIINIRKTDFANNTNLKLLALNNNIITRVAFMAFAKLSKLQEIWLRHNELIYIPRGLPDNLRKLYMDYNQVVNIEEVLFSNKSKIEYLTLENNRVVLIKTGSLSRLQNLNYLNLQGNSLTNLTEGMFDDLRNITTLTLSNNPIQRIESGAFRNLDKLTFLYMSYIPPVEDFYLGDNFLTAMPQLQKLSMMGSQSLVKSVLHLIDDTPIMEQLTEVDLTYNDMQTVPAPIKKVFPNVQALSVEGNILVCDHRLLWLAKWMKETDIKFFSYEEPVCDEPPNLKGVLVNKIPLTSFVEVKKEPPPKTYFPAVNRKPETPTNNPEQARANERTASPAVRQVNIGPQGSRPAKQIAKAEQTKHRASVKGRPAKTRGTKTRGARRRHRGQRKRKRNKNGRKRRRRRRHHKKTDEEHKRRVRGKGHTRNRKRKSSPKTPPIVVSS